jgi:hypothetical protein
MKTIVSVKEARKILGKDAKDMTDDQITKLVEEVDELAILALEVAKDKLRREKVNA